MTKQNCPVSLHGVTERAFDQIGNFDAVNDILPHLSRGRYYDVCDADRDPSKAYKLTFGDVRTLTRAGATAFAEDLARLCGMQLVPITSEAAPMVDLMARFSALMRESGEACATGASAIADGKIDDREASDMHRQLLDVATEVHGLIKGIQILRGKSA